MREPIRPNWMLFAPHSIRLPRLSIVRPKLLQNRPFTPYRRAKVTFGDKKVSWPLLIVSQWLSLEALHQEGRKPTTENRKPGSVPEVPHSREDHSHPETVSGGDHICVLH